MYVADPLAGNTFAAMPVGVGDGLAKSWPRWFAGASGLVMTRTLPAGSATMQPLGGVVGIEELLMQVRRYISQGSWQLRGPYQ
jgi:hypothetical protein